MVFELYLGRGYHKRAITKQLSQLAPPIDEHLDNSLWDPYLGTKSHFVTDGCVPGECPGLGDRAALTGFPYRHTTHWSGANPQSQVCDSGLPCDEALETGIWWLPGDGRSDPSSYHCLTQGPTHEVS